MAMVCDFYANLREKVLKKVWVKGKWVAFDSEEINRLYNLPVDLTQSTGRRDSLLIETSELIFELWKICPK